MEVFQFLSLERVLQKIRKQPTLRPSIPLLGIYLKDAQSYHKDMCSTMFTEASFMITRTWKQPKCPSTKEWTRKMWYIYTMEYYTVEKNNDILKFAGKWMDIENILLREVIQTQKDKYNLYLLISGFST